MNIARLRIQLGGDLLDGEARSSSAFEQFDDRGLHGVSGGAKVGENRRFENPRTLHQAQPGDRSPGRPLLVPPPVPWNVRLVLRFHANRKPPLPNRHHRLRTIRRTRFPVRRGAPSLLLQVLRCRRTPESKIGEFHLPRAAVLTLQIPKTVGRLLRVAARSLERSSPARCALHSHTTTTLQPASLKAAWFRRSRAAFPSNFSTQKARLLLGVVQFLHPRCRCQKHPWTKTTVLYFGMTMSGRPGSPLPCRRNRYPIRCNRLRTIISGVVSFPRIRLMFQLRRALLSRSAMFKHSFAPAGCALLKLGRDKVRCPSIPQPPPAARPQPAKV